MSRVKKVLKIAGKCALGLVLLLVTAAALALTYRAYKQSSIRAATRITAPNGIESLETVTLGGATQWIYLRGHDQDNPVLLFLHGGPGSSEMAGARDFGLKLEEHFTVVHWDQRASGKSRREAYPEDSLTMERFLADTVELINILRERFGEERIYLAGHSWGSVLGIYTARDHPELLHAYIGIGQVVNIVENEQISYQFTLARAKAENNTKAIEQLEALSPPYDANPDELFVQRKWLWRYRGAMYNGSIARLLLHSLLSPEYSLLDHAVSFEGMLNLPKAMWPDLKRVDMFTQAPKIDVPVYFFVGRHDYNTPFELVERYCQILEAPHKEIVWFENSAHMLNIEEPERYQDMLIGKVLADRTDQTSAVVPDEIPGEEH